MTDDQKSAEKVPRGSVELGDAYPPRSTAVTHHVEDIMSIRALRDNAIIDYEEAQALHDAAVDGARAALGLPPVKHGD